MPSLGAVMHNLLVARKDKAVRVARHRMLVIGRKADIFVELHHRKSPFFSQFPDRRVENLPAVVPMSTQDDDRRLAELRPVVLRTLVILQIIAVRNITLYHIIITRSIVAGIERQAIVLVVLLQTVFIEYVLLMHMHDDKGIHLVKFLKRIERSFSHLVGRVRNRFAAYGPVDCPNPQRLASHLKPTVVRLRKRSPCQQQRVRFRVLPANGQRKEHGHH